MRGGTAPARTRRRGAAVRRPTSHDLVVDECSPGQVEEDVLQRRAPHEHAVWVESQIVDAVRSRVAVVRVQQEPVWKRLETPRQTIHSRRDLLRLLVGAEAELDDLSS